MCSVVARVLLGDSNAFSVVVRVLLWTVMFSVVAKVLLCDCNSVPCGC